MNKLSFIFLFIFLSVFISACTIHPRIHTFNHSIKNISDTKQIHSWHSQGKIGARFTNNAWSASFDWVQEGSNYKITLLGPFNTGSVSINGNSKGVTLKTGKESYHAQSPEHLMQKTLGWSLPIGHLRYWIRALPVPNIPNNKSVDQQHRLTTLNQAGWEIKFQNYQLINHVELPTKLTLTKTPPQGNLRVRFVINHWEI